MDVKFSLKSKMTLTVCLFFFGTLSLIAVAALSFLKKEFSALIAEQQFAFISEIAEDIDAEIARTKSLIVETAAVIPPEILGDAEKVQKFLDTRLGVGTIRTFDNGIFLFSAKGTMIAEYPFRPGRRGRDYSYRRYFQRTISSGEAIISDPYFSSQSHHHPSVNFTAPIVSGNRIVGVLAGSVDLTKDNFLGDISTVSIGKTGYLYLFNTDRLMIMHPNRSRILKKDVPPGANVFFDRAIQGFEGTGETVNSRGLHTLTTFRHLETTDWILAANYPVIEAHAPIRKARGYIILGLAALMGAASLLVWLNMRHLIGPLSAFAAHLDCRLGDGQHCGQLEIKTRDEIGLLASAFNKLMHDLDEEKNFTFNLLQNSAVPCLVLDSNHRILVWTLALEELTGIKASRMIGTDHPWVAFYPKPRPVLANLIVSGQIELTLDLYDSFANSPLIPEGLQAEGWFDHVGGKQRYLLFEAAPVRNSDGEIVAAIETIQDFTRLKQTEEALRESGESYHALIDQSPDAIIVHRSGRILFCNQAAVVGLGADDDEKLADMEVLQLVHPDDRERAWQRLSEVQDEQRPQPYTELKVVRVDGTTVDVEVASMPVNYMGQAAVQTVMRDITLRKEAQEKIWRQANFDALTSLPNRNLFFDRLRQALHHAEREKIKSALLYIDLDGFKEINDTHGHQSGDVLLQQVGERLLKSTRKTDTVARLGGDEFSIILPNLPNTEFLDRVAGRIIASLAEPFFLPFDTGKISASIGIAVYPDDDRSPDGLLKTADHAMYRAKDEGKNRFAYAGE